MIEFMKRRAFDMEDSAQFELEVKLPAAPDEIVAAAIGARYRLLIANATHLRGQIAYLEAAGIS
jgi:hypothetical protein